MFRTSLTLLVVSLLAVASAAGTCTASAPRSAEIDAAGIQTVRIVSGPGAVNVRGSDRADLVTVQGEACASTRGALDDIRLDLQRRGETLIVTAVVPRTVQGARLDVDVRLPGRVAVEIEDGSGDLAIADVAALTLRDGSGHVTTQRIRGNLRVEEDGSGDLTATEVGGDVTVVEDGSGQILLRSIGGDVLIQKDGSGDITVETVGGDFTVHDAGSGAVRESGVAGTVRLPAD